MKKHLTMLLALLLVVAVAAPALAAVEFKYGGQFRTRWVVENNKFDGTDGRDQLYRDELGWYLAPDGKNYDDNRNLIDTRLRLYFSFIASQNLKVVTKLEMGDSYWGDPSPIGTTGNSKYSTGGRVGADAVNVELKNAYVEFNIPMTPSTAIVGIQTLSLLDSWIIDDDFSAAVIKTKLDPVSVTVGYVSGQNGPVAFTGDLAFTDYSRRIDDFFLSIDYKHGPFKASLIGFYQYGHDTNVSFDPNTLFTPAGVVGSRSSSFLSRTPWLVGDEILYSGFEVQDNNLFDLGFNVSYKIDYLSAYVNFVKNLGSVDLHNPFTGAKVASADYTGWMVDAGVSYYCGPYTLNLGGFYTTGPDLTDRPADFEYASAFSLKDSDITWFTYPLATAKYFSEIIGGGILGDDRYAYRGYPGGAGQSQSQADNIYWRGYGFPTNLWTITAGAAWQVAEKTKISASYWYFGTAESVPTKFNPIFNRDGDIIGGDFSMSNSIGHELNLYIDQGIVDGLNLTLVGAYLFANDAFSPVPTRESWRYIENYASDAYEVGARLQWNF